MYYRMGTTCTGTQQKLNGAFKQLKSLDILQFSYSLAILLIIMWLLQNEHACKYHFRAWYTKLAMVSQCIRMDKVL